MSPYLTGACIEDVNHEIYGSLYSQMIFGESFQEPSKESPVAGYQVVGGQWNFAEGVLTGGGGDGPKLVRTGPATLRGVVSVDVQLPGNDAGNGGLILAVGDAKRGADNFRGYEVSLDCQANRLIVGRHDHDFRRLAYVPCPVPADEWIGLRVVIEGDHFSVDVNDKRLVEIRDERPLPPGTIGLRQWQRPARYRNLELIKSGVEASAGFTKNDSAAEVSGMWDAVIDGDAVGRYELVHDRPFVGSQCQRIVLENGSGAIGVANRGLNRWGMTFRQAKPYQGYVWLRSESSTAVSVSLENSDGTRRLATQRLSVDAPEGWERYELALTPSDEVLDGRVVIRLEQPGQLDLGHAFLQPGPWGRFKDLPVRRDIVEGLLDQGVTALRYGGSMVDNPPDYRWKNMIGPRDRREPYDGHWYDESTNGWGILDFLDLCDAAGFLGIPCFSIDETPADMADFLEYAGGGADTRWGAKRISDGRANPYRLRHIQLGNEESVNEAYWDRFEPIARTLWNRDPNLILIVGDFQFDAPITDPFDFSGSPAGITSLATHQRILALAKELDTEVWFDTHVWTGGPDPTPSMNAFFTYVDALEQLADGAKHRVVVFEFNANNHRQRRALANAEMIGRIMRDGRVPMALSANCLQPDGQNDNGWDQGLLFLNGSKVWLQPPGYVTQMIARAYQPWVLKTDVSGTGKGEVPETMDVVATGSKNGNSVIVRIVNRLGRSQPIAIQVDGMTVKDSTANVVSLSASFEAHNTAEQTNQVTPQETIIEHQLPSKPARFDVPPYSFTTIRIE
ncbi:family 16 glycoside hydrolase [Roseiconus nitratireducens]|uniref:family 16 glycoside hydrolase n=1 Tax=Roseiconus nitratireducens TaxID=2605748 RepID=UPI00137552A2|nr:family 16 glycoside hydrolase [Roseiconus nitratireducens]